jgi:hypothetical protein
MAKFHSGASGDLRAQRSSTACTAVGKFRKGRAPTSRTSPLVPPCPCKPLCQPHAASPVHTGAACPVALRPLSPQTLPLALFGPHFHCRRRGVSCRSSWGRHSSPPARAGCCRVCEAREHAVLGVLAGAGRASGRGEWQAALLGRGASAAQVWCYFLACRHIVSLPRGIPIPCKACMQVFKEVQSYDTVGNGFFSALIHAVPAGWR